MKVGIIGAGRIGGSIARQLTGAGHEVLLSFSRDPQSLITDAGFVPVDLGGIAGCAVMEAPRRPGAVYGEEYRVADASAVVDAVRAGQPIPPAPQY
jgi:predicted dinucleotide-binding enzyme